MGQEHDDQWRERLREKMNRRHPPGWDDFTTHLRRLYVEEKSRHRSILGVHELDPSFARPATDGEVIRALGYEGYESITWPKAEGDDHGHQDQSTDGGELFVVRGVDGEHRTIVTVQRKPGRDNVQDAVGIAVFLHEIGHVDDFEKKRFLVPGRSPDFVDVELYAHRFACKRMIAGNFRFSLGQYLSLIEKQHLPSTDRVVRTAAERFVASGEFRNAVQFAGDCYRYTKEV